MYVTLCEDMLKDFIAEREQQFQQCALFLRKSLKKTEIWRFTESDNDNSRVHLTKS